MPAIDLAQLRRTHRLAISSVTPMLPMWASQQAEIPRGTPGWDGYSALVGRGSRLMAEWGDTPQSAVRGAVLAWVERWAKQKR